MSLYESITPKPDIFNMRINNLGQKLIFDCDGKCVGFISPMDFSDDYYHKMRFGDCPTQLYIQ